MASEGAQRDRRAVLAILDFLRSAAIPPKADPDAIAIAIDCLSTAYDVDPTREDDLARFRVQPGLLRRLLDSEAYPAQPMEALRPSTGGEAQPMDLTAHLGAGQGEVVAGEGLSDGAAGSGSAHDRNVEAFASLSTGDKGAEGAGISEAGASGAGGAGTSGEGASGAGSSGNNTSDSGAQAQAEDVSEKLPAFLEGLEKSNFYAGTTPGSWEYLERQRQARKLFEKCVQQQQQAQVGKVAEAPAGEGDVPAGASSAPADPGKEASKGKGPERKETEQGKPFGATGRREADKAEAERLKAEGNKVMTEKRYADAAALYTQAITLNDANAIYWANRAAAHLQLCNFHEALIDSQQAIQLDPTYSKAYSRLGHAHMGLRQYKDAIELGFKKALELDSNNTAIKDSMKAAKRKLDEQRGEHSRQQEQQHWGQQPQQNGSRSGNSSFSFTFPPAHSSGSSAYNASPPQQGHFHFGMPQFSFGGGAPQGNPNMSGPNGGGHTVNMEAPPGGMSFDPSQLGGLVNLFQNVAGAFTTQGQPQQHQPPPGAS